MLIAIVGFTLIFPIFLVLLFWQKFKKFKKFSQISGSIPNIPLSPFPLSFHEPKAGETLATKVTSYFQ